MMRPANQSQREEYLRKIPYWMEEYAGNRSLPNLLMLGIMLILFCAIGGFSSLAGWAYRTQQTGVLVMSSCLLVLAVALDVWLSVPAWGGRVLHELMLALYRDEGIAAPTRPADTKRHLNLIVAIVLILCITGFVLLGFFYHLPARLMQPVSALILVPFVVIMTRLQSRAIFSWGYLWAGLYTIHALLLVLGAPLYFTGPWVVLDMLLPVFGYGLFSALVGFFYSQVMLFRITSASHALVSAEENEAV